MRDAAHEVDAELRARVRHGVTFGQWAFVLAGLGDGLALEELLTHLRLDEARWESANAAFNEDLLDDVETCGVLTEQLDEAMRAARSKWKRPLPPLDVELRAWLDFQRAWAASESPLAFLEERGMGATDLHRLQQHWSGRLADEAALRAEAGAILGGAPGPVPTVKPAPAHLGASPRDERGDMTGAAARRRRAPLPFVGGEPGPAHPRLSVPLPPKPAARSDRDVTRVACAADVEGLVLPFLAPEDIEPEDEPSGSAVAAPESPEWVPLPIERYAALCVDLITTPDARESILQEYGITEAERLRLDVHWTAEMAEDSTIWLAWDRACTERRAEGPGDESTGE
ncbi:hypothetical protein A7982_13262 [Minicystis rosea]|nr:hypothetical protein A7982_13262 [Minicystis rosea]